MRPCFKIVDKFFLLLSIKRKSVIDPTKVLTPTKPRELIDVVLIIRGIVPHKIEIEKIKTYAL
tara:strand:- start:3514 stop:3702 length:189 start_codon:yes stop_codon:yes gene_type:complete